MFSSTSSATPAKVQVQRCQRARASWQRRPRGSRVGLNPFSKPWPFHDHSLSARAHRRPPGRDAVKNSGVSSRSYVFEGLGGAIGMLLHVCLRIGRRALPPSSVEIGFIPAQNVRTAPQPGPPICAPGGSPVCTLRQRRRQPGSPATTSFESPWRQESPRLLKVPHQLHGLFRDRRSRAAGCSRRLPY